MAADEPHLLRDRREKLEKLRRAGHEPFPWAFPGRVPSAKVVAACAELAPGTQATGAVYRVAGRVRAVRTHGKSSFVDLVDQSGELQLYARVDELGEETYQAWLGFVDPGDLLGASGLPTKTRRGEPSLLVHELVMLAKALAPPPEKFHGLKDPEERLRRRHLDLLASAESRRRFEARSLLLRETRRFLDTEGFLEVETNSLVKTASGAAATPFRTR